MTRMFGIIVPIVTPFDEFDHIDYQATRMLVDSLINKGINCLYPCGTTGEMLKMSLQERKDFAKAVVEYAQGRVPVFIQVGASTTKETLELARHAMEIGSAGIGVVTPQFLGVNDREMEEYYVEVANSIPKDFPVYLYNIPQCAGNDIKPTVVNSIVRRASNVVGIKYSYPDFIRFKDYLLCNDGNFDVVVGPDRLFLPAMAMGCVGTVTGCAQCCPEPFVAEYKAIKAGDWEKARQLQIQANEMCEIVHAGANMAYFKAALEYNGLPRTYMRKPALDLTEEERNEFITQFASYKKKNNYERYV